MPTPPPIPQRVQARLVDSIKRRALRLSLASPSAEAWLLEGYLWCEERAEGESLARVVAAGGPAWLERMLAAQLQDEARHARLIRVRLAELGRTPGAPAAAGALARLKLGWLERIARRSAPDFARGEVVPLLACAARLEATGVRIFGRHLSVLNEAGHDDGTRRLLARLLEDERRHATSCAAALERLVEPGERPALERLQERVAGADRALGVTSSLAVLAACAARRLADAARAA